MNSVQAHKVMPHIFSYGKPSSRSSLSSQSTSSSLSSSSCIVCLNTNYNNLNSSRCGQSRFPLQRCLKFLEEPSSILQTDEWYFIIFLAVFATLKIVTNSALPSATIENLSTPFSDGSFNTFLLDDSLASCNFAILMNEFSLLSLPFKISLISRLWQRVVETISPLILIFVPIANAEHEHFTS